MSSAPQNEVANQIEATTATMPVVVEDSWSRRIASLSVLSAAEGKSCSRSIRTEAWISSERRMRPAMNRATSATGKIDSRRLYATIEARPVRLSS